MFIYVQSVWRRAVWSHSRQGGLHWEGCQQSDQTGASGCQLPAWKQHSTQRPQGEMHTFTNIYTHTHTQTISMYFISCLCLFLSLSSRRTCCIITQMKMLRSWLVTLVCPRCWSTVWCPQPVVHQDTLVSYCFAAINTHLKLLWNNLFYCISEKITLSNYWPLYIIFCTLMVSSTIKQNCTVQFDSKWQPFLKWHFFFKEIS